MVPTYQNPSGNNLTLRGLTCVSSMVLIHRWIAFFKNVIIFDNFTIYKGKSHKSRKSHKSHKSHPTNPWDGICGDGRDLPNPEKHKFNFSSTSWGKNKCLGDLSDLTLDSFILWVLILTEFGSRPKLLTFREAKSGKWTRLDFRTAGKKKCGQVRFRAGIPKREFAR